MFLFPEFDRNALLRQNRQSIEHILTGPSCRVLLRHDQRFLVDDRGLRKSGCAELEQMSGRLTHMVYLGRDREFDWFAADLEDAKDTESLQTLGLRQLGLQVDGRELALLFYAQGMLNWHVRHGYCAGCGSATEVAQAGHARQCSNPECGRTFYPKIDPAVIFSIENKTGPEPLILLGRKQEWEAGRYSVIAGFVEPGEMLEDAVRREALEETGITVSDLSYIASQPWPFPDSLMCAFHCMASDTQIALNDQELEDADWFSAADLATGIASGRLSMPYRASVAWRLIDRWYLGRTGESLDSIAGFVGD